MRLISARPLRAPFVSVLAAASFLGICLLTPLSLTAADAKSAEPTKAEEPFENLEWRSIGPVNMGGRVADVEGIPGDPGTVYVGSASGGVWKTTNGGLTFKPIFDDQDIASIGDLALAPSNPEVIYVGTGEDNPRNSVSFGNGVYKSTDGGDTWRHLGLEGTRHISRVLVHPANPDLVYVAALGSIYAPNPERGIFRSRDGGKRWTKVLYLDDRHGASDLDMDPNNPNILFAGLWHFDRKPWTHTSGSKEGGIWKSVDGGDTWKKVEKGLPELTGRLAVKIAPSNGQVVYVLAESNDGILFRSDDRGETFHQVNDDSGIISRGFYYTELRVDPTDENRLYSIASRLFTSIDGGRSFQRISQSTHVDYHTLWIDPEDPSRLWQGQDGGVAVSYDRGVTWEPIRNLPIAQYYQIFVDDQTPFYFTGGGLQDNGTWRGPSRTREPAGILEDEWRIVSFGDAYFTVPHPDDPNILLSESQGGGIVRTDVRTRQQIDVSPQARRNDGGPVGELDYRFNWNAPIIASPHDPSVVYFAGNVVFKTRDFGDTWEVISPDLTTDDESRQGEAGGPVWVENTTAEYYTTIISFAESPAEAGVLWAGTDDGNLQLSRDGGESWKNIVAKVPGVAAGSPVSHIEPSRTAAGTAYVAFDRHMFDDFDPHLFKTTDFGATWKRIGKGLPDNAWIWVVREDPVNHDLLYAGTELGLFASWNAGATWKRLHLDNLPTVAVHDILVHPRENDLLLGTHGRAIWIFDDATPIQRFGEVGDASSHLFPLRDAWRFPVRFTRYGMGDKTYQGPNPSYGALISYYLEEGVEEEGAPPWAARGDEGEDEGGREDVEEEEAEGEEAEGGETKKPAGPEVTVEILDSQGTVIRTLKKEEVTRKPGINRIAWDLTYDAPKPRRESQGDGPGSDFFGGPRGPQALPGTYTVRLTVDDQVHEQPVDVVLDPGLSATPEALRAGFDAALELRDRTTELNLALRSLDVVKSQLKERRALLGKLGREMPEGLEEPWKETDEKLKTLYDGLVGDEEARFWSQGPRLSGQLGFLGFNIADNYGPPTAAQKTYLDELQGEASEALQEIDAFLNEALPQLNALFTVHQIPEVAVPDPAAMAKEGRSGGM